MTNLARKIAERLRAAGHDTSDATAERHLRALVDEITEGTAMEGDRVAVPHLGVFRRKYRPARSARNPATGAPVDVPEGTRLTFSAATALRD